MEGKEEQEEEEEEEDGGTRIQTYIRINSVIRKYMKALNEEGVKGRESEMGALCVCVCVCVRALSVDWLIN